MRLGVAIDGGRAFIGDLLADWQGHYQTEVFSYHDVRLPVSQGRVNKWRRTAALRQFLRRNEVVFFEWAGPLLIEASTLPAQAKIVARLHSYELYEFAPHVRWESVDRIILVSEAMQRRFRSLYPSAADKTRVVYYGKSMDVYKPPARPFAGTLGMLGNVVPIKRVYEAVLVLYELNQNGACFTLRLGGSPAPGTDEQRYYTALRELVNKLHLEDQVIFDGQIANPAEFLSSIDVFISNSFWEGQQNALLEAMASGCYCLSHVWGGAEEVLPAENLFVTDRDLREKILTYAALPEPEKQMQRMRMRTIAEERFDIRQTQGRVRNIIDELANIRPGSARGN